MLTVRSIFEEYSKNSKQQALTCLRLASVRHYSIFISNHTFSRDFYSVFPPISRKGKKVNQEHELDPENLHQAFPRYTLNFFLPSVFCQCLWKPTDSRNILHSGGHSLWNLLGMMLKMLSLRTATSVAGYSQPGKELRLLILSQICLLREGGTS